METDVERRARVLASDARWRLIFAALAVVIPLALHLLFARQERRLRELVAQPVAATARVIERGEYVHYEYFVDGVRYTWNVGKNDAPPDAEFPIVVSARDPSLSRVGAAYTQADYQRELALPLKRGLVGGLFVFFAGASLACHLRVRRLRKQAALSGKPLLSPRTAGFVVGALVVGAVLATNLAGDVQAVQAKLFGERPLGIPVALAVTLVEAGLFAPFFWVFAHLMTIVMDSRRSFGAAGIILSLARTPHTRSRNIVIAGFVYFVALMGAWIAFTSARGV